jgi:hypothetical protein
MELQINEIEWGKSPPGVETAAGSNSNNILILWSSIVVVVVRFI